MKYFLSLGSNLKYKKENLSRALVLLKEEGFELVKASSIYETQPVDFPNQPWFLNQVVEVKADFSPKSLLTLIKKIENKMGRKFTSAKGSRIIDIDILMAEKSILKSKQLEIPHPRLEKRSFILIPFKEISPDTVHPILKKKIKDLWEKNRDYSKVIKLPK